MLLYRSATQKSELHRKKINEICAAAGVHPIVAEILINRGMNDLRKIQNFFTATLSDLHDPFLLHDMKAAVERILAALVNNEKITVYGDYDVDGVTSTSILMLFLKSKGANVDFYIPSRHTEGYGLNTNAVKKIADEGSSLLITVDCGITAVEETEYAKQRGLDVIITDHHECGTTLPHALAVINPKRDDQNYPFPFLAGVGVTAKLIHALGGVEAVSNYLDIIAVGTVADLVPIVDENRILVKYGLKKLNEEPCMGLEQLIKASGYHGKELDSGTIAFGLAPRMNAGGRIGHSGRSVILLTTDDTAKAVEIACELNQENQQRQEIENEILRQALEKLQEQVSLSTEKAVVLYDEAWHPGVIGIVASRLVERLYRPVIILSKDGENACGSGRSIPGVNLFEALSSCSDLFQRFGGHEQAAGLTLPIENIAAFRSRLNEYLNKHYTPFTFIPTLPYDVNIEVDQINISLIEQLAALQPFGMGNPSPVFCLSQVKLEGARTVGKDASHLKIGIHGNTQVVDGIGYRMGYKLPQISRDSSYDMLVNLEISEWNGTRKPQCNIKSLKTNISYKNMMQLIEKSEEKFFRAFLEQIIYNNHVSINHLCNVHFTDCPNIAWHIMNEAIKDSIQGSMILVHTARGLQRLINYFKSENVLEYMKLCFNAPDEDPFAYNVVVAAPNISKIDFSPYDRIILYDGFLCIEYIHEIMQKAKGKEMWIFFGEVEIDAIRALLKDIRLDREELGKYYRFYRSFLKDNLYYQDLDSLILEMKRKSDFSLVEWKIYISLVIFCELGFMKCNQNEQGLKAEMNLDTVSRNLSESPSYRKIIEIQRSFERCIEDMKKYM